jgi:hypothetical protein
MSELRSTQVVELYDRAAWEQMQLFGHRHAAGGPMRAADAYGELLRIGRPIVQTREAATRLHTSTSSASHLLRSIEQAGLARRLRQGLWALHPTSTPSPSRPT